MSDLILSITVLTAFLLIGGALYLWRSKGNTKQAILMAVLAFVMIANVAIWLIPEPGGAVVDSAPPAP